MEASTASTQPEVQVGGQSAVAKSDEAKPVAQRHEEIHSDDDMRRAISGSSFTGLSDKEQAAILAELCGGETSDAATYSSLVQNQVHKNILE